MLNWNGLFPHILGKLEWGSTKMGLLLKWGFYWNGPSTGMEHLLEWGLNWNGASTGMELLLERVLALRLYLSNSLCQCHQYIVFLIEYSYEIDILVCFMKDM